MGVRVFKSLFALSLLLFEVVAVSPCFAADVLSQSMPTPLPTAAPVDVLTEKLKEDPHSIWFFKKRQGEDVETIRMINSQDQLLNSGNSNFKIQDSITGGQDRAKAMVQMLQNEELQKVLPRMTEKGNQMLRENPELQAPVGIIAGTFALWSGKTVKLIKGDNVKVATYIEAKSRSGDFRMESPLLNGKLQFNETDGVQLNVNRSISSIDSSASVIYSAKNQSVGGQVTHSLFPHLNLNYGTSQSTQTNQVDQRAWIDYQLRF